MTESAVGAGAVERYLDELLGDEEAHEQAPAIDELAPEAEKVPPDDPEPETPYLLIQVAGIRLAVPTRAVRCYHENSEGLMPGMSGHALMPATADLDGIMTAVLDLAAVMLPSARLAQLPALDQRAPFVLELAGLPFALISEIAREPAHIDTERVQWRGPNGQRLWLAGTCADQKIAILDLDGLAALTR